MDCAAHNRVLDEGAAAFAAAAAAAAAVVPPLSDDEGTPPQVVPFKRDKLIVGMKANLRPDGTASSSSEISVPLSIP